MITEVYPKGGPTEIEPPLFDSMKLKRLERLQKSPPQLYSKMSLPRIQDVPRPSALTDEDKQKEQPRAVAEMVREMKQYMEQRSKEYLAIGKMFRAIWQKNTGLRGINDQLRAKVKDLEQGSEEQ